MSSQTSFLEFIFLQRIYGKEPAQKKKKTFILDLFISTYLFVILHAMLGLFIMHVSN